VYNGDDYVRGALDSILSQTYSDFECVIIDDASSDTTPHILREYASKDNRIHIHTNDKNMGLTASLQDGLSYCNGKYIARMDVDDIARRDRFEKQYAFMEEHPDVALCGSFATVIDEKESTIGKKIFPTSSVDIKKRLLFNNQFVHSTLFFIKEKIVDIGGYDVFFKKSQDYDLVFRVGSVYTVANIPEYLVSWRLGSRSISWQSRGQEMYALRARWNAITRYGYPKINGIYHIVVRAIWLCVPLSLKRKRYVR